MQQIGGGATRTFFGHCISRARLSSSSWEIGSTRFRKAAFLYRMSLSDAPSRPRSYKKKTQRSFQRTDWTHLQATWSWRTSDFNPMRTFLFLQTSGNNRRFKPALTWKKVSDEHLQNGQSSSYFHVTRQEVVPDPAATGRTPLTLASRHRLAAAVW